MAYTSEVIVGDRIGERFMLEAIAGEGAMGVVFRARDVATGRLVALKALRSPGMDALQRFAREAEVLAALSHPNIVQYITHGRTPSGEPFLVMEWLDGVSLRDALEQRVFRFVETIDIALAVVSALEVAHARGVVHRDLKPANVFLVGNLASMAKVVDFGIARLRGSGTLTSTGTMLGTPAYMSPEQASGAAEVDGRSDLYSLGAIVFSAVTGKTPFEGGGEPFAMLLQVTTTPAPAIAMLEPFTPPRFAALVDALLATEPNARPSSATVVRQLLGEAKAEAMRAGSDFPPRLRASFVDKPPSNTAFATTMSAPTPSGGVAISSGNAHATSGEQAVPVPIPATVRAPPSRSRSLIVVVAILAVLVAAGGTVAVVQFTTHVTSSTRPAKKPPSGSASAVTYPWCPAVALTCEELDVDAHGHVDVDAFIAHALKAARAVRPGAEIVRIAGNGMTDEGLDLGVGGGITVQLTKGISVSTTGAQLKVFDAGEMLATPLPSCTIKTAYARARAGGLPAKPSAHFDFEETQVNFLVDGSGYVSLDGKTCMVVKR